MSITLSHTRLTKQTSLIHSHTLAYCQDTRSHSMHALAVMHSRTLSHTHHDRVSRVGSGSVLREVCACAVVTTSSLLRLSCGKRQVSTLRALPSPFSLPLRLPLRCRYQPQRETAQIMLCYNLAMLQSFFEEQRSFFEEQRGRVSSAWASICTLYFDAGANQPTSKPLLFLTAAPGGSPLTAISNLLTRFNIETRKPTCSYTSLDVDFPCRSQGKLTHNDSVNTAADALQHLATVPICMYI